MEKKKHMAFAAAMAAAVGKAIESNGLAGMAHSATIIENTLIIRIALPGKAAKVIEAQPAGLTTNAVARYNAKRAALGLPAIGKRLVVMGMLIQLVGLSTDAKRVKVIKFADDDKVVDLPIADVLHAVSLQGAKQVAELDAQDAALPDDEIDPAVLGMLATIGKKAASKPAEGQQ